MDLLTKHNRLLDEQLIQEQYVSRSLLLNRLLNNQYDNIETINKSLENYRVILNSAYFTVCIFRLNKKPSPQFFLDNMLYYAAHPGFSVYCTLAVSYTHLDVYKRQPFILPGQVKIKGTCTLLS